MTDPNVLVQTAGSIEKMFSMILWKLQKDKSVSLTEQDIKDFVAAHETEAQLIVHGSEDGLRFQVLSRERAAKFIEEYKAAKRGVVLDK